MSSILNLKRLAMGAFSFIMIGIGSLFAQEQQTYTNPVNPVGRDPWVIRHDGHYYYCYRRGPILAINRDRTLQGALANKGKTIWEAVPNTDYSAQVWAPELHFLWGKWYVYFTASNGRNERHRMYALESVTANPMGEYKLAGKIETPDDKWAIDATPLELYGRLYCLWSGWEGDENVQQNIYIAPMSDPLTISGERVLISEPTYGWERVGEPRVNEGPQVLKHEGNVFVIYSASGSWTDHYCLGQLKLVGLDPLDPDSWQKKIAPVFGSTSQVYSPGHASFTKSPDGTEDWIVYHANDKAGAGWDSGVRMQRFSWDRHGDPAFGYPVPDGLPIPAPSGETDRAGD